jgi:hypothetical protein
VASLAAALTAGPLDKQVIRRPYQGTGGHPLYLRTVLSEGSGFDPGAAGRLTLPRSLASAVGDHLRVLPPSTRAIREVLSVVNQRMALGQLSQAAQVGSPSTAVEPAVAAGLVDWWPDEPSGPVRIRHSWSGTPFTPRSPPLDGWLTEQQGRPARPSRANNFDGAAAGWVRVMLQADEEAGHGRDTLHNRGRRQVRRWDLRQSDPRSR